MKVIALNFCGKQWNQQKTVKIKPFVKINGFCCKHHDIMKAATQVSLVYQKHNYSSRSFMVGTLGFGETEHRDPQADCVVSVSDQLF